MSDEAVAREAPADISERLLESGGISIDRLPMLKAIVDRLASYCADGLRQVTSAPVYMLVKDVSVGRVGQILDSYGTRALAAVYHVNEWEARILLGLDRGFVFSLVEVLFGGDGCEPPVEDERTFTSIELRVAQRAFDIAAESLKSAFAAVADLTFAYERTESRLEFAIAGRRNNLAVLARIGVQIFDRAGEVFLVIPQQALNPLRQLLANDVSSFAATPDPRWSRQIEKELHRTAVLLRAIIDANDAELGDVARWRVGDVIPLKDVKTGHLRLECEGQSIFRCDLGQAKGFYTLRVGDAVDPEAEFLDDVMA